MCTCVTCIWVHVYTMIVNSVKIIIIIIIIIIIKANVAKCADLGWVCVPVVAESYGAWGLEAIDFFSKLASCMATSVGKSKSVVLHELYGRLNIAYSKSQFYGNTVKGHTP